MIVKFFVFLVIFFCFSLSFSTASEKAQILKFKGKILPGINLKVLQVFKTSVRFKDLPISRRKECFWFQLYDYQTGRMGVWKRRQYRRKYLPTFYNNGQYSLKIDLKYSPSSICQWRMKYLILMVDTKRSPYFTTPVSIKKFDYTDPYARRVSIDETTIECFLGKNNKEYCLPRPLHNVRGVGEIDYEHFRAVIYLPDVLEDRFYQLDIVKK